MTSPLLTLLVVTPLTLSATAFSGNDDKGGFRFAQKDIVIADQGIDPIITGQTGSDTPSEWERRREESLQCQSCNNPYPGDVAE